MRVPRHLAVGRLTKRPEFLAAASGRRFHTDRMSLQGRRREDSEAVEGLRVGFTITKRIGHATERNRIRRRLRSAAAEAGLGFRTEPVDVVVIGRRPAMAAPFATLVDDLSRGLGVVIRPKAAGEARREGTKPAPVRPART